MYKKSSLSGVHVVLVMAYGSLVFVLLFIFLKRQIMRSVMKSHRRQHNPVGHNAPKQLREKIKYLLSEKYYSRCDPRLLSHDDVRLKHRELNGNYLYRMQALDAIKDADIVSPDLVSSPSTRTGSFYRNWLLILGASNTLIKSSHSSLIDRLLKGYHDARHGTRVFGEAEFLKYKKDLAELVDNIKAHSRSSSMNQQHQTAAKVLMSSTDQSTASTSQVMYLHSSSQHSKGLKHFLEL